MIRNATKFFMLHRSPADPAYGNLILDSTGATFNRGDFTTTNAFFWSSLDLSPYEGTDLGSTPYYIEVLDGASKKATGYIGAVGAGSELVSNPGFEIGDPPTDWTTYLPGGGSFARDAVHYSGSYSGKLINSAANVADAYQDVSGGLGIDYFKGKKIYLGVWINTAVASRVYGEINDGGSEGGGLTQTPAHSGSGSWEYLFIDRVISADATRVWAKIEISSGGIISAYADEATLMLDCPATAVHIVSSLNGTTRDWASIESGFDPNDIASWTIWGF